MVHIQQCKTDDLAKCSNVFREVSSEDPSCERWTIERSIAYLSRIYSFDPGMCYIAKENDEIVGAIFGYTFPWSSGTDFFIQELFVARQYRGMGIRKSLVECALDKISEESDVILVAKEGSESAKFYERHGIHQNLNYKFFSGKFKI